MSAEPFFRYPSGVRGSGRRCLCSCGRRRKPRDPRAPVAKRLVSWCGEQRVADPQGWGARTPLRLEALSDTCALAPVHEKCVTRDTQQESVRHALTSSTTHCCRGPGLSIQEVISSAWRTSEHRMEHRLTMLSVANSVASSSTSDANTQTEKLRQQVANPQDHRDDLHRTQKLGNWERQDPGTRPSNQLVAMQDAPSSGSNMG